MNARSIDIRILYTINFVYVHFGGIFVCVCVCVCVCVRVFIIYALNALSRCVFIRKCTCQDVSSVGRGPCVCVHVCVFFLFISALMHCHALSSDF